MPFSKHDGYDVIIIGGGVMGTAIARELARYKLKIALLEKSIDLAAGASRANTGLVHAGFDPHPGTLKAKLNLEGNRLYAKLTSELNVPFKRNGALVIAFTDGDINKLEELQKRGDTNGVTGLRILNMSSLKVVAPGLSDKAVSALYAPTAGIVSPYELVFALAENAAANGVSIFRDADVKLIDELKDPSDERFELTTTAGMFLTKVIINAAGIFSDTVANMVGINGFSIRPRRGEYLLLDKSSGIPLEQTLFPLPTPMSKGIVVTPTTGGNILMGPNTEDLDDKLDAGTTGDGQLEVLEGAKKLVPSISKRHVITTFAGLRTLSSTGDFIIGPTKIDGFINAAGIQSPGLTAAPAIALMVTEHMCEALGLEQLPPNEKFNPSRPVPPAFSGRVVCRCEHVTEAGVLAAVRAEPGARTLDGIKLRTRAGMGRCQGGYCTDHIIRILSNELHIPLISINKHEQGSWILANKTKVRGRIP